MVLASASSSADAWQYGPATSLLFQSCTPPFFYPPPALVVRPRPDLYRALLFWFPAASQVHPLSDLQHRLLLQSRLLLHTALPLCLAPDLQPLLFQFWAPPVSSAHAPCSADFSAFAVLLC